MKIKAYTLMEVTVAMLLSAICMSICYTAYYIITGYYTSFHQKNKTANEVLVLRHMLEGDFLKSRLVFRTEDSITLQVDTTKIYYVFTKDGILRKFGALPIDTFKLQSADLKTHFEHQEVLDTGIIDRLNFTVLLAGKLAVPIQIHTFYSAKDLFK